jgi:hypothetical protein
MCAIPDIETNQILIDLTQAVQLIFHALGTRLQPQRTRCWKGINTYLLPPSRFITMTMKVTMVTPA